MSFARKHNFVKIFRVNEVFYFIRANLFSGRNFYAEGVI